MPTGGDGVYGRRGAVPTDPGQQGGRLHRETGCRGTTHLVTIALTVKLDDPLLGDL